MGTSGNNGKGVSTIVLSCAVWGPYFARRTTLFQRDNLGLVAAITKGSSKDKTVMHLLRSLRLFAATFDIHIVTEHIAGTNNCRADMLSRNNITQFLLSNPQAHPLPTLLPQSLLCIISPQGPDWTSSSFRQCFTDTITMVSPLVQDPAIHPARQVT